MTNLALAALAGSVGVVVALKLIVRRVPKRAATLSAAAGLVCKADELSLCTFNCLADCLVSKNKYSWVGPGPIEWKHRWGLIQGIIQQLSADIICLQEVEVQRIEEFRTFMESLGYNCVFQDRKSNMFTIANATFYNAAKLELTWSEDRSRVLLTTFRLTRAELGSKPIFVANCHLEGHPYKPHERFNQLKSALHRLRLRQQALKLEPDDAHVLVTGDLNSTSQDGVYRFLYRGRLEGGWTERYLPEKVLTAETVSHPFMLRDVYASCAAFRTMFTRAVPGNACVIDYIFVSHTAQVVAVLQYFGLVSSLNAARAGLPNSKHPSDHVPLGVVVKVGELQGDGNVA